MPKTIIESELPKNSCFSRIEINTDSQPQQMILTVRTKTAKDIFKNIDSAIRASRQHDEISRSNQLELNVKLNDGCITIEGDLAQANALLSCPPEEFIDDEVYMRISKILEPPVQAVAKEKTDKQLQVFLSPINNSDPKLFKTNNSPAADLHTILLQSFESNSTILHTILNDQQLMIDTVTEVSETLRQKYALTT